ncbi:MAG TPA: YggT family protein, partial [Gammaproteobacteria bacterium]|nr:YggT family protein [Gammaproteobacteria bacterium]
WPSILLMLILQAVELVLISLLKIGIVPAVTGLLVLSIAQLLQLAVWIYIVLILIQVILSWVNPHAYSPVTVLMYQLTDPIMRPVRRMIPPAGGFDWSPLVVIIALNLILILVIAPLGDLGQSLSYRALSYPAPALH